MVSLRGRSFLPLGQECTSVGRDETQEIKKEPLVDTEEI
jgi:hypothetical protein